MHRGLNAFLQGSFDGVLVARSTVSATKCGPLAKMWGVNLNFENFGRYINLNTANALFFKRGLTSAARNLA